MTSPTGPDPGAPRDRTRGGAPGSTEDGWPVVALAPWTGPIPPDHPDANFLADVATVSLADPMPTLQRLSHAVEVPVGALVRYVVAKWATAGSEAVLATGPSVVRRLRSLVERLEAAGDDDERAAVVDDLVEQVQWLAHGVDDPTGTYPAGGAEPASGGSDPASGGPAI